MQRCEAGTRRDRAIYGLNRDPSTRERRERRHRSRSPAHWFCPVPAPVPTDETDPTNPGRRPFATSSLLAEDTGPGLAPRRARRNPGGDLDRRPLRLEGDRRTNRLRRRLPGRTRADRGEIGARATLGGSEAGRVLEDVGSIRRRPRESSTESAPIATRTMSIRRRSSAGRPRTAPAHSIHDTIAHIYIE